MINTCIIILVLAGIALVANVAICLYSLSLMKKYKHRYYNEGYIAALMDNNFGTDKEHTITFVKNNLNSSNNNPQENPAVPE